MSNPNPNQNANDYQAYFNILNNEPTTPGSSGSTPSRPPPIGFSQFTTSGFSQFGNMDSQQLQQLRQELGLQPQFGINPPNQETQTQQPTESSTPKKRSHQRKGKDQVREVSNKKPWSQQEEVWLATCWIDTSEDPILGNSQRRATLWGTIARKFNENQYGWVRGEDALSSKWRAMDKACKSFQGCWLEEKRNPRRSGRTEEDDYDRAVILYVQREMKNWGHKEAWEFLMDKPKWHTPAPFGGAVIGGEGDTGPTGTIDMTDDGVHELTRPPGRERSKAARRSASSDAATSSSGTNSSKMEELIQEVNHLKTTVAQKQLESIEAVARSERMKGAMKASKFIASIDMNLEFTNPRAFKRLMKMQKKLIEEYGDLLQLSDDEDE